MSASTTDIRIVLLPTGQDLLTDIIRDRARRTLARAAEAEGAAWIDARAHLPERTILTGIGTIAVKQPRVHDRRPHCAAGGVHACRPAPVSPADQEPGGVDPLAVASRASAPATWRALYGLTLLPEVVKDTVFAAGVGQQPAARDSPVETN